MSVTAASRLWSYDGEEYALTDAGIALRDGGRRGGGRRREEEMQNDDEDDGGEEDEEEEQATSTQLKLVLGSVRWHPPRALRGHLRAQRHRAARGKQTRTPIHSLRFLSFPAKPLLSL